MGKQFRSYEVEGKLYFGPKIDVSKNVWLDDGTPVHPLADGVLSGPGGQFIGKRVRITITLLEDLKACPKCGDPTHESHMCPTNRGEDLG